MSMTGTRRALTALSLIGLIVAILVAIYYASDGLIRWKCPMSDEESVRSA